jgi:hypothetical protein
MPNNTKKSTTRCPARATAQPSTNDRGENLSASGRAFIREHVYFARAKEILRAQSAFEALAKRASLAEVLAFRLRFENSADLSAFF